MRERRETLAVLVRAPAGLTYAVLTDVDGWDAWWPGCRTRRDPAARADGDAADHHVVRLPGYRRCRMRVHGWRHDEGFRAELRDGMDADVAWWLGARPDGTTVVDLHVAARGWRPTRSVRALGAGLQALKDHLELAVDVAAGRVP